MTRQQCYSEIKRLLEEHGFCLPKEEYELFIKLLVKGFKI